MRFNHAPVAGDDYAPRAHKKTHGATGRWSNETEKERRDRETVERIEREDFPVPVSWGPLELLPLSRSKKLFDMTKIYLRKLGENLASKVGKKIAKEISQLLVNEAQQRINTMKLRDAMDAHYQLRESPSFRDAEQSAIDRFESRERQQEVGGPETKDA